jgi:hypothetical protein
MRLYTYLATEFITYNEIYHSIQPISGIIQTLHTLKNFYWIVDPNHQSKVSGTYKIFFSNTIIIKLIFR